jgi:hypothetical protein
MSERFEGVALAHLTGARCCKGGSIFEIGRVPWFEVAIAAILACAGGTAAYWRASALYPVIDTHRNQSICPAWDDTWFDGDIQDNISVITDRFSQFQNISAEHPLIPVAMYAPVFALRKVGGLTTLNAIRISWAALAAIWSAALFWMLRAVGCRRLDAAVFATLGIASAASVFWFIVPERFAFGSLTIVLAVGLCAVAHRAKSPLLVYGLVNVLTLSMTVSNWMLGIVAAVLDLPWRRALLTLAAAFLVVTILWRIEATVFPRALYFVPPRAGRLAGFTLVLTPTRVLEVIDAFFLHTVVMPEPRLAQPGYDDPPMTIQHSYPGSGGPEGLVAAGAWIILLGAGAWAGFSAARGSTLIKVVGITTAGQLGMHIPFGRETFLYSLHFLPLLLVLASCVTRTRFRAAGLALAIIVTVFASVNNHLEFLKAAEVVESMAQAAGCK